MDYDVAAASLASPPASAPVTSYRPAVAVANLGIHPATVTGTLRIYDRDAGTLLKSMLLASTDIAVGQTKNVLADQLWEPTAGDIGKAFLFIATVVYPPDQYLPNNNLAPVTVIVTAAPPPPPPPVAAHASQHENGGADELDVEGLTGKLAENQKPTEHASNHEEGGEDQLDVAGLAGELATPQTPKAHHATHEEGGSDVIAGITPGPHATEHEAGGDDEISVANLSGELATAQPPKSHGNAAHSVTFEDQANRAHANGYCDLNELTLVPSNRLATNEPGPDQFLKADRTWDAPPAQPPAVHGNEKHDPAMVTFEALGESLADYQLTENKDTANGYAGLDGDGLLKIVEVPESVERTTNKGEANGYAPLDGDSKLPTDNLPIHGNDSHEQNYAPVEMLEDYQATAQKDTAGGYCGLDVNAVVPAARLANDQGNEGQVLTSDGAGGQSWENAPAAVVHGNELHDPAMEVASNKGQANGYADLDSNARIPFSRLPLRVTELVLHSSSADEVNPSGGTWYEIYAVQPSAVDYTSAFMIGGFNARSQCLTGYLDISARARIYDADGDSPGAPQKFALDQAAGYYKWVTFSVCAYRQISSKPVTKMALEVWVEEGNPAIIDFKHITLFACR
jgi:hypothetical protein